MAKNVLIIGNGGREHAISWKLAQSSLVKNIFVAPGSYGIGKVAKVTNVLIDINNYKEICEFCKNKNIHLVAVGPENPLANGIVDVLNTAGYTCFGPTKQAAQIESDKSWAKYFMHKHNIPTARWKSFTDVLEATNYIKSADHAALVVKASGLAAGKGVVVAKNIDEACSAVNEMLKEKKFGQAGETIIVEELLEGEEVSVLAFTDGDTIKAMLPAQDHKRIGDGDKGLNTGGMGAYCPCPLLTNDEMTFVQENILDRTISGFKKDKIKFVGVLYAGLMLTKDGPKVLEFNCRFGDPETQVLLPLLDSDLYIIMEACCNSTLNKININWKKDVNTVGVIMASKGYPETSSKGDIITGIEEISNQPNHIIFHSGTNLLPNGKIVTNGGRVLIVVSLAPELIIAATNATQACGSIYFDGAQYRKDIAHKGIARILIQTEKLTYKSSGVNIENGNHLVNKIKPLAKSTSRLGLMSNLGGFGGLFDIKAAGFKDPILVSGTDGVGTKLKIAQISGIHRTIGIDLVAMCVNDILAHGAEPLFFLDYFACGQLDIKIAEEVILGIAEGCHQAGCALIGGETAEMPDMYSSGDYDLAGFAVGAVERSKVMPRISDIKEGDLVIALPSSGIHSNGFSLVRRVILQSGVKYTDKTPFSNKSFAEELLTPTKIYVKSLLPLIVDGHVKAFAHITGGGLLENIPRVLPHDLKVLLNSDKWSIPPIFGWLAALGEINEIEMLRTFNCGIGGIIIVSQDVAIAVLANITDMQATVVGTVKKRLENEQQVSIKYFKESLVSLVRPYLPSLIKMKGIQKKRVGVLISGSGTNLQSLIDSTLNPIKNIGAEIVLVISNKPNVEGLKRAERANILTKIVKHSEYPTRVEFDRVLHNHLIECGVEIVCLAGFMRILSGEFVQKWHGRLLNIHPSLLPSFKGTHAQKQALNAGVKITGCTVHFVEEDIDAGTIILQRSVPVLPGDTEEILTERIKLEEHKAFPEALHLVATGQVYLNTNNLLEFSQ